ncbi:bifunctional hydroxymethylpyrimidine kinase/phosphomethylpyrimidine kinase [Helicobacter pylori]|nr:bifunctional hydroxymethylpyrimidine kinase/phosphomethylpyrimidine kinase [Helicobacter pylori]
MFDANCLKLMFVAGSQDFYHIKGDRTNALLDTLELALQSKITAFQFRQKGDLALQDPVEIKRLALECQKLCKKYGTPCNDWVFLEDIEFILNAKRFNTKNTHGTGCVLSSLIVGLLAQGLDLKNAITKAKELLTIIIQNPLNIGHGHGPLNLWSVKKHV